MSYEPEEESLASRQRRDERQRLVATISIEAPSITLSPATRGHNEELFEYELTRFSIRLRKAFGPQYRVEVSR